MACYDWYMEKSIDEKIYLMGLAACPVLNTLVILELLKIFDSAQEIWKASKSELRQRGVPDNVISKIDDWRKECDLEKLFKRVGLLGLKTVDFREENYPATLKEIPDLPLILYYRGEIGVDDPCVSIVGNRKISGYGQRMTQRITQGLVNANLVIVSGLALGVDGVAHQVAVENKAKTIGVLAHGLDRIYPSSHTSLAKKIIECGGAIISEYPPGDLPLKHHFLERNRVIAGLSMGTLVVEAGEKSGALTTARCSLDYGRSVWAVPGDVERPQAVGVNNLIKQGAMPVFTSDDILQDLNLVLPVKLERVLDIPDELKAILELLESEPKHINQLSLECNVNISTLSGILLDLEIRDLVKNTGGMNYIRF